jgi:hypothetical protein
MKSSHVSIAILGAGLTGMSAAMHLKKRSTPFRIFEKLGHAGGHAITLEEGGYRFDRTGHLMHLRDAEIRADVLRWLKNDWVEVKRRSVVFSHGVYTRYPYQANTFGLPPAIASECLLGFVQAHFRQDKPVPKNFEEFCNIHFGEGISRHFIVGRASERNHRRLVPTICAIAKTRRCNCRRGWHERSRTRLQHQLCVSTAWDRAIAKGHGRRVAGN